MKKILLSSVVLLLFSTAMLVFQMSCKKDLNASPNQQNKVLYVKLESSGFELWTVSTDGSNKNKVPLTLPSNLSFPSTPSNFLQFLPLISPDGNKIILTLMDSNSSSAFSVYSCNIDGTNLTLIGAEGIASAAF